MSSGLVVDFCSHKAAKYAVEHWHYSKSMPTFKVVKCGVWEGGEFIGVVLYSSGANHNIGKPYGLDQTECSELTRVALRDHDAPVSKIVMMAQRLLHKQSSGIRLLISYADPEQDHHGGIYQAMNWFYVGESQGGVKVWYNGKWTHQRTVDLKYGNHKGFRTKTTSGKHKYLYPLDKAMRRQIMPLAQPYPK